jgi:hypothetical protein
MTIYISGAITGQPDGNKRLFNYAEAQIVAAGHKAINPHKVCEGITGEWSDYMRACIKALMDADAILLLPEWENSRGAKIEMMLAVNLGLHTFKSIFEL